MTAGRRFFSAAPGVDVSGPVALYVVLALQGNGLQPIPAARCLAPLKAAEQVAPDRPSRLQRCV
ncbi:hypothetical protein D0911_08685 [Zhongshania marina]|uniref:Uncharacterized protein n=1 Tax=Zhongshania marina TaxID=2304603 RepID=A0ABX9W2S6_9GAMM|nr:hypothetical protein D0911_08685 [Zhongshania marina]